MDFVTKLDFTSRQVKQAERTFAAISGGTSFGMTFSALTSGPNLYAETGPGDPEEAITKATYGIYNSITTGFTSTYSGNSATTVYNWAYSAMSLGQPYFSALTPVNSAQTQNSGLVFTASVTTVIDGNTVALLYSGVSFDITPLTMVGLGGGNYSGTVETDTLNFYTAETLDYTGRTIWVDVSGIARTERLIITNLGAGPGVIDVGIDNNGFLVNNASDIKLKENINTIDNALNKVLNLRGVTYNWKDRSSGGDALKIGFIAQEVNNIVPELVYKSGEYMSVHYKDITALLVEAIKELINGNVTINVNRENLNTQTVVAEDNNIELNYNGNHETSVGGGIIVLHAIANNQSAEFMTDVNGNFTTNTALIPNSLVIPEYTPASSTDTHGIEGELTRDDNYLYLKGKNNTWKRINLENF